MVVVPQQSKVKIDDDDDEDVEALRLAALKSLRTKDAMHKRSALSQVQKVLPQVTQSSRFSYKNQRPKKNYFHNRVQQRQNGVSLQFILFIIDHNSNFTCEYKSYYIFYFTIYQNIFECSIGVFKMYTKFI